MHIVVCVVYKRIIMFRLNEKLIIIIIIITIFIILKNNFK